jgi:hypothetical protein
MIGDNEKYIFEEAVALLKTVDGIKRVEMFNNQVVKEDQSDVGLYPAVFIEMKFGNHVDLGNGVQKKDCAIALHTAFECNKQDSRDLLVIKQRVFSVFHRFQPTNITTVGKFLRYGDEEPDYDHDNLEDHVQIFLCTDIMDFDADTRPTATKTATLTITPSVVTEITN